MVTKAPEISSSWRSSGIAVISLDFSGTTTWPSDSLFSVAHAETSGPASLAIVRTAEGLAVDRNHAIFGHLLHSLDPTQ